MATAKESKENPAPQTTTKKRVLKKKLQLFAPYVKWHVGLVICGHINRRFINRTDVSGEKENLEIRLADPCTFTTSDGEVLELKPDTCVNIGKVAGLTSAMSLDVGTLVQIECIGKKEMGKGKNDAWDFEVSYE